MNKSPAKTILWLLLMLIALQTALFGIKHLLFLAAERTDFSDRVASMAGMSLLAIIFCAVSAARRVRLSVFPEHFGKLYIIGTALTAGLLVATPSNYIDGAPAVVMLIYSSVVTPVYEELIFRGYVWNRLRSVFLKERTAYILSTFLFAVWHLGYIDSIAFRVQSGLAAAMVWKVITGLCFGVVLGALRLKTKNCYSTMLLHSVMNIFGR